MRHQPRPAHSQMLFNLFSASLEEYEKWTGITPLSNHPLTEQLRYSDSAESVTAILKNQVPAFEGTDRITKSLSIVVSVLHTLPVSVDHWPVSPPLMKSIYAAFAILLATAKEVSTLDPLVHLLESIGSFLKHLDICTKVPRTAAMAETLVKTAVELLSILGLATKLIKQRQPGTFVKKLFGGNYDQMVLERLNRLTLDEARITVSQILIVVYCLVQNIRVVIDGRNSSIDGILDALEAMQYLVSDMNTSKCDRLRQGIRCWLSPPDPSVNHKIACELRHMGTTAWFVQGDTFSKWKWSETNYLLWIHGKPGAGKSILCSAIIQDIDTMRRAGLVSLAYYYCDFRDDKKNNLRGLVSSLLVQLCHQSDCYCDVVSKFYLEHALGSRFPSNAALVLCLKRILKLTGQPPVYLIVDAVDECPNTSDMIPVREKVLMLVRQLTASNYLNLRICVSSRIQPDLGVVLEPLAFRSISLHDESGQKEDIASYIKSVVHTDPKMKAWRADDKRLVINSLTHKVDGIFQWASCQFAYLRQCPQKQIPRTLGGLPETLGGTYQRTLRDIDKADRVLAHRLFSCISVARRPLHAEELVQLLEIDFKTGPFRQFRRGRREEYLENTMQTTYSSLLAIVKDGDTTIIQLPHSSVQEFFENASLADASANISYYHVPMAPTHTLLAQTCLDVLLRLGESDVTRDGLRKFPLAEYAAEHWLSHVRLGNLSNNVEDRMERLFDPRNTHFVTSLRIHPEVPSWMRTERAGWPLSLIGSPLHHAALWGLHTIVKFLVIERSQDVEAPGFIDMVTPLHLAAKGGHVEVARFLLERSANVTARDMDNLTPLHLASREGHLGVARLLIDHGAEVISQDINLLTPLHLASREGRIEVAFFLIDHGADVNARDMYSFTSLHLALREGQLEVARLLIGHGADLNAQDMNRSTPLHLTSRVGQLEVARFIIDRGGDVTAQDMNRLTPLHLASREGKIEVARLLIDHGADVNARDIYSFTPLHLALREGQLEIIRFLIDQGANVNAWDMYNFMPLHLASREGHLEVAHLLIDQGADVAAQDMNRLTPLHLASRKGEIEVARLLIDHGADVNAQDMYNFTPLHLALRESQLEVVRFLIDHGAYVNAQDTNRLTPLHLASREGQLEVARFLIDHGANVNARDMYGLTPLHQASRDSQPHVARTLLERGGNADARNNRNCTSLHLASQLGHLEVVRVLIEHGTDPNARDHSNWTPLHGASQEGHLNVVKFLLDHGADLHASDHGGWTSLHLPSHNGNLEIVRVLLKHGANANTRDNGHWTPLHGASQGGYRDVVLVLLEHGADVDSRDGSNQTPLHGASKLGHWDVVPVLLEHRAVIDSRDDSNQTPLHGASQSGHRDVVLLLLEHGADVDSCDDSNQTPLHGASQRGHRNVVILLLEHGANVDSRDDSDQTPLHVAARAGCLELVPLLVESGADINARNNEGRTPLEEAAMKGHPSTVQLLSQFGAREDGA